MVYSIHPSVLQFCYFLVQICRYNQFHKGSAVMEDQDHDGGMAQLWAGYKEGLSWGIGIFRETSERGK